MHPVDMVQEIDILHTVVVEVVYVIDALEVVEQSPEVRAVEVAKVVHARRDANDQSDLQKPCVPMYPTKLRT